MDVYLSDQIIKTSLGICLDPSKVDSLEELELAYYLARKSFEQNTNISKNFNYEFLLFLSGKKDISSALTLFGAKEGHSVLFVVFDSLEKWGNLKKATLKKSATPLALERISLSRI